MQIISKKIMYVHSHRVQPFLISTITSITTQVQTTVISCLDHCDCL